MVNGYVSSQICSCRSIRKVTLISHTLNLSFFVTLKITLVGLDYDTTSTLNLLVEVFHGLLTGVTKISFSLV